MPKYFMFSDAIINGIFKYFVMHDLLLGYRSTIDFCLLAVAEAARRDLPCWKEAMPSGALSVCGLQLSAESLGSSSFLGQPPPGASHCGITISLQSPGRALHSLTATQL